MGLYCAFGLLGILTIASSTPGDSFVARRLNAKLPIATFDMASTYDGESDFIYLVGGYTDPGYLNSILRFDITTEKIELIGRLPIKSTASPLVADSAGNLVYFNSMVYPLKIYKFNTINYSLTIVGESSKRPYYAAATKNSAGKVLLAGGSELGRQIWEFNIDTENVQGRVVGEIPLEYFSTAAAAKVANDTILLFGANNIVPYFELNIETLETKRVAENSFPTLQAGIGVTRDRDYVYIFGGNLTSAGLPLDGIIQLDPITHAWNSIQVADFPLYDGYYLRNAPAVVWVEKLNRIYMFGGRLYNSSNYIFMDDIYYIDMTPINPTTSRPTTTTNTEEPPSTPLDPDLFSCVDRTDGTHPHPSDCSKYIACRNGVIVGVYPCSPPLLYDPVTGNCNLPSLVDCELSCENKADGTYPHPHECSLFIICSNRDLFVFWCYPPLLFDPQELQCTLPELVQCAND